MFKSGDVISYLEMCQEEGVNLQRGMNFHLQRNISVILMSLRRGAPYADRIEENGRILIYEGHDVSTGPETPNPKVVDQPMHNPSGTLTQNGLFYEAAMRYKREHKYEVVKVYEKIQSGIWVYNGTFKLTDSWQETNAGRRVFKFKLELMNEPTIQTQIASYIDRTRVIPSSVKLEVWKRDKGQCVRCGSRDNLHFDHIIPFSKGGASMLAENIQLLCARHNLEKRDRIQ